MYVVGIENSSYSCHCRSILSFQKEVVSQVYYHNRYLVFVAGLGKGGKDLWGHGAPSPKVSESNSQNAGPQEQAHRGPQRVDRE